MENNSSINSRIAIRDVNGGDIAYIYQHDILKKLGLEKDKEFTTYTFLDIGTIITLEDIRYEIKNIRSLFLDNNVSMKNSPGINLYGIGE